jgi:tetratricopeptide (TPR) repeat protein
LLTLVVAACQSSSERAQHDFLSGRRYFDQSKFAEASIEFRKALKREPRAWEAHYYLGLADLQLHNNRAAYQEFQSVLDLQPSFIPARLDLADLLLSVGEIRKARAQVESVQETELANSRAQVLLAKTYFLERDYSRAVEEFEKAKSLSPQDASVWALAGVAKVSAKQYALAENDLHRALELDPNSAEAYVNLANLWRLSGRTNLVEALLHEGLAKVPKSLELDLALADFYLQQGRLSDIDDLFSQLKKQAADPSEVRLTLGDFWLWRGEVSRAVGEYQSARVQHPSELADKKLIAAYLSLGRVADAERLNKPLVKKNPHDLDARAFDGALAYLRNDFATAGQELQLVVKDEPQSLIANYYLGLSWLALDKPDRARDAFLQCVRLNGQFSHAYLKLAELAARAGDWKLASDYAKELLQLDPRMGDGYFLLVQAYLSSGDITKAESVLRLSRNLPESAEYYELAARISALKNDDKAASDSLGRALALSPQPLLILARYADFQSERGRTSLALTGVKNWMANAPPVPDSYELLARLYIKKRDFEGAESACRKALELGAERWLPHFLLGEAWRQRSRSSEALAEYDEAIRRNPHSIQPYIVAGDLEMDESRYEKAKSYLEAAKQQDPDSVYVTSAFVRWYAERGENLDVALGMAQDLRKRFPEDQYLSDTLGWLLYQKRLYSLALEQLKPAGAALPENATVQYHLGMTYLQIGQPDRARQALRRALKLGLARAAVSKAEQTLTQLGNG